MTYISKKCPQCGKVYERDSYSGHPSKENRTKYGSPIKVCLNCGAVFNDDDYREIEIYGIREVDLMRVSPSTYVYTAIGLFIGIGCVVNGVLAGWIFVVLSAFLFSYEFFSYNKRQKILKAEAEASKRRMQDPEYRKILRSFGYPVSGRDLNE
ncbi:MAG: hypothetical protein E7578_01015 [Ruminococcaceae bacterium]|nr:hypothetical protein [Oscillospiraceae bacterium]